MRILVELIPDDLVAISQFIDGNSSRSHVWSMSFLISALLIGFAGAHSLIEGDSYYLFVAIAASIFLSVCYNAWVKRSVKDQIENTVRQMINDGKGGFGKREYRIEHDGLSMHSSFGESTMYWGGIVKIEETEHYFFIGSHVVGMFIIPREHVLEGDVEPFMAEVEKRWKAHARDE